MKKLALTIAIVMGIAASGIAQERGLFGRAPQETGYYSNEYRDPDPVTPGLALPGQHGQANDVQAPIGSGALLLIGFGAAYALKKKK